MSPERSLKEEAGFTLIEALVALAIVAIALSSIGGLIAIAVKGTRSASQRVAMTAAAETLLNELPARVGLTPGRQSGDIGGNHWRVEISPLTSGTADSGRWLPLRVSFHLQASNGPSMRFSTVRVVPITPQ